MRLMILFAMFMAFEVNATERTNLHWRNGKNHCTGTWEYTRFSACKHKSHPVKEEIFSRRSVCGVEKEITHYATCRNKNHGRERWSYLKTVEIGSGGIEWRRNHAVDKSTLDQKCRQL